MEDDKKDTLTLTDSTVATSEYDTMRYLDEETIEILVEDKIATGG